LDSIYDLTGAGFEPVVRPFFFLIRPRQAPILIGAQAQGTVASRMKSVGYAPG